MRSGARPCDAMYGTDRDNPSVFTEGTTRFWDKGLNVRNSFSKRNAEVALSYNTIIVHLVQYTQLLPCIYKMLEKYSKWPKINI